MSRIWVKNVSFTIEESSEIAVVLKRHLKEVEEVLEMEFLVPFTKQGLEDEVACVKNILKKLNMED